MGSWPGHEASLSETERQIMEAICGKFPELFAHAETVDTSPLFPQTTWPGCEAKADDTDTPLSKWEESECQQQKIMMN